MVLTRTHGIDKDLWYRQGLMVLTTPMVLTKTHVIESVLLNHTNTRGPSVACVWDFFEVKCSVLVKRDLKGLDMPKRPSLNGTLVP